MKATSGHARPRAAFQHVQRADSVGVKIVETEWAGGPLSCDGLLPRVWTITSGPPTSATSANTPVRFAHVQLVVMEVSATSIFGAPTLIPTRIAPEGPKKIRRVGCYRRRGIFKIRDD